MKPLNDKELLAKRSFLKKDFCGGRVEGRLDILREWHDSCNLQELCDCDEIDINQECYFIKRIKELCE